MTAGGRTYRILVGELGEIGLPDRAGWVRLPGVIWGYGWGATARFWRGG
jgi:hypothetical protein